MIRRGDAKLFWCVYNGVEGKNNVFFIIFFPIKTVLISVNTNHFFFLNWNIRIFFSRSKWQIRGNNLRKPNNMDQVVITEDEDKSLNEAAKATYRHLMKKHSMRKTI